MATAMRHLNQIGHIRAIFFPSHQWQKSSAKRACVAVCIASTLTSGFSTLAMADDAAQLLTPAVVVHAVAEQATIAESSIQQVVGKQPASKKTSPSRALFVTEGDRPVPQAAQSNQRQVQPAAGIMDGWFGGQTSKVAKKESEDGRKATALPPPDPSTVDWRGVPFHQPRRTADDQQPQGPAPIRDVQQGPARSVPSSTANLRRQPTTSPPPSQSMSNKTVPSKPISATKRIDNASIPPLPSSPSILAPRPTSRVAVQESETYQSTMTDLSVSSSSRRSGRKVVDALDAESIAVAPAGPKAIPTPIPTAPVAMTEPLPVPTVPRREMMPLEKPADVLPPAPSPVAKTESIPLIPSIPTAANSVAKAVPTNAAISMEDEWNSVGSGVRQQPVADQLPAPQAPAPERAPAPAPVEALATTGPRVEAEPLLQEQLPQANKSIAAAPTSAPTPAPKAEPVKKPEPSSKQLAASELPGIRVITEGPSEIMIRELTQYEVRVENRGSFDATGIVVRSSLPAWAEVQGHNASLGTVKTIDQSGQPQLQWTVDKLPAGVVERMFVRVKAVKSGMFDVATEWTMLPQKHIAKVTVREPKLAVVIDGPDEIIFGRSEKYRVRVMNPGDGDASNVVFTLAPDSKSPQTQQIGNIPAGKEAQFEIELTARELGNLKIGGVAMADREVKSDAIKTIRIAAAVLEAELTGPSLKYQNSDATYHLLVTNTGKANCDAMTAELRLPNGVKYISGIPQATMQGDRLTWKIDALQPASVREYDIVCKLDRTGEMVLTFNCDGSAAGHTNVAIETRVEAIADLVLSISDPVAPAPVNADVVYEITILNRGSKAAEEVRIVAQFSHGIEPIRVEGQSGEVVPGQALFSPIARIEPGSTVRLKITAKADRAGDHRFRTEVRHGETSLVAEEATMYLNAPAERVSRRSTDK